MLSSLNSSEDLQVNIDCELAIGTVVHKVTAWSGLLLVNATKDSLLHKFPSLVLRHVLDPKSDPLGKHSKLSLVSPVFC
jgi:hypothetical protein